MKITCNQQILSKTLNTVSKAVSTRTTLPVLKGILLEAKEDGTLTLTASDLEISIQKTISVNVEEPGSAVVVSKLFGDIIRKLPNEEILLEQAEDHLIFDAEIFKDMVKQTSFAASVDESKGVLVGVLTEIHPQSVSMVALDGYRLAVSTEKMNSGQENHFIISAKIINEISKIIAEDGDAEEVESLLPEDRYKDR